MTSELEYKLERKRALADAMASVIALGLVVDVRLESGATHVTGEQGTVVVNHAGNGGPEAATILAVRKYMDDEAAV